MFCSGSFTLMTTLQGRCHYTHFIDEETEAQRCGNLPKGTQSINGGARIATQSTWFQSENNCHLLHVTIFLSYIILFDLNISL